jgi:uncharacterized protein YegL
MRKNLTEMVFILDRSGSMENLTSDTIGGFNSMIENQKNEEGEAYVTTVLFDDKYEILHDHVNIQNIEPITNKDYYARGMTALLDAVGKTINSIGSRLSATPEEDRPDKVIFVITTDGCENASREFTKKVVKEMIEHQQDKYSWTFMFLGANMDAVSEAASLGINTDFAKTYTANSIGTQSVYTSMSKVVSCARGVDFNVKACNSTSYMAAMDALDEIR